MTLIFFKVWLSMSMLSLLVTFFCGEINIDNPFYYFKSKNCARIVFWPLTVMFFLIHGLVQLLIEDNPMSKTWKKS